MQTHVKIQEKFKYQFAKLVASHYIKKDLYTLAQDVSTCIAANNSCNDLLTSPINHLIATKKIKPFSYVLILHTLQGQVFYYLRLSVVPSRTQPSYALYRDDITHNAVAMVENIQNFVIQISSLNLTAYSVKATILFDNNEKLEIACTLAKHNQVIY